MTDHTLLQKVQIGSLVLIELLIQIPWIVIGVIADVNKIPYMLSRDIRLVSVIIAIRPQHKNFRYTRKDFVTHFKVQKKKKKTFRPA